MSRFQKKKFISDGWVEGPFAHSPILGSTQRENQYFMQWVHPLKLHRLSLFFPIAYRVTHGFADDIINDDIGIRIPDNQEITREKNNVIRAYLRDRKYIREWRKFVGNTLEQGEAVLLYYYNEENMDDGFLYMEKEIHPNTEVLGVEAFNLCDYRVIQWDENGDPQLYTINLKNPYHKGTQSVRVHASRVIRFKDKELLERESGYPLLSVLYDSIVVLTSIVKACGEAAFRWGTGHPLILTKNVTTDAEVEKMQNIIGIPTRRSWHILPSEFIERFELIGQAGQMLNLRALWDIVIDNIASGSKIPKTVLIGESQVSKGEVENREYYGVLYEKHVLFDPFIRACFYKDINLRKIITNVPTWEIDYGVRQVLNKMDEIEYKQREISNALAATAILTINECRAMIGYQPLPSPEGDIVLSLISFYMTDETENAKKENQSTKDRAVRGKDLEKDKTVYGVNRMRENKKAVKDALNNLRSFLSVDEICDSIGFSKPTYYKLEQWSEENA